jgi:hypothetical protein
MAGYLWFGWQVSWYQWLTVTLIVAISSLLWLARPIRLQKMAYRLDRLLGSRAQLITAFEVSQVQQSQDSNPVAEHLIQDAVTLSVNVRRDVRTFGRGFWLEMNALIAVAAVMGAMFILDALAPSFPNATPLDLPPAGQEPRAEALNPPDAQLQPPPLQPPPMLSPAQVQAALEALADALRDQAVTRGAAEAIDRGDLGAAAQELRRVADQLEELSENARQDLSEAMASAAEAMGGDVPGFSEPLRQGSQELSRANLPQAGQALEELAETLDRLEDGAAVQEGTTGPTTGDQQSADSAAENDEGNGNEQGSGDGAGAGEDGEANQGMGENLEERLPIDGEPLELESDSELEDRVLQPAELGAESDGRRTTDSPFARQPLNATGEDLGADPLTYPWEKREVVRKYFTP